MRGGGTKLRENYPIIVRTKTHPFFFSSFSAVHGRLQTSRGSGRVGAADPTHDFFHDCLDLV